MVEIMLTVVVASTLAVHLGLSEAISDIVVKIAKCGKCTSFWCSLTVLWLSGADVITAVALSVLGAYLSYYFGLLLMILQYFYTWLRERIERRYGR